MTQSGLDIASQHELTLSAEQLAVIQLVESLPGTTVKPMGTPRAKTPSVLIYKVMDKMYAILAIKGEEGVIVKCESDEVLFLRDQFAGIGHKSHLDSRFWISIALQADVPAAETERLILQSYDLITAKLTRKQKAELAAL